MRQRGEWFEVSVRNIDFETCRISRRRRLLPVLSLVALIALAQPQCINGESQKYPRIANLYGAALSWVEPGVGMEYWQKLGLVAGGGSDWHYDYESPDQLASSDRAATRAAQIRKVNPAIVILPYVDVIEGPDNPRVPASFWLKDKNGARVSTWPGYFRVDTSKKEVLAATAGFVETRIFSSQAFSGVFLDCWKPDSYLVPRLRKAFPNRYIMTNAGNLPQEVSSSANGALSEDELNRAAAGEIDVRDLMDRYRRWMRDSSKPAITSISCCPRTIDTDPWRWARKNDEERRKALEEAKDSDPAMMRFGLCFTLMDDGYFAYDGGTQHRGSWWWYPEYDAPLGEPKGACVEIRPAFWRRDFSGAAVFVNGSDYDESISFDAPMRDFSTGRIGRSFVVPRVDGRIFVPATLPAGVDDNGIPMDQATFIRDGSGKTGQEASADGRTRWLTAAGLELFLSPTGMLDRLSWKGTRILSGGHPVIVLPEWREIQPANRGATTMPASLDDPQGLVWRGIVGWSESGRAEEDFLVDEWEITVAPGGNGATTLTITDRFQALRDFEPRMWRQYFFLPVSAWAGRRASLPSAQTTFALPKRLGSESLGGGREIVLESDGFAVSIRSGIDYGLVDHRKYNTSDYLWAGYPAPRNIVKGYRLELKTVVEIRPSGKR